MKATPFLIAAAVAIALSSSAGASSKVATLRAKERAHVRTIARAMTTLRFFEKHPRLLCAGKPPLCSTPRVKARAWHAVAVARQRIIRGRAALARIRDQLARASIRHRPEWLCIQRYETPPPFPAWRTNSGNGYYGGVQMDAGFEADYGADMVVKYGGRVVGSPNHRRAVGGHAYLWTPEEQMMVAERALPTRGFHPWPVTARKCGLI